MKAFLLAFALFLPTKSLVTEDRVDAVEVNTIIDEKGKPCFEQVIFWDFRIDGYRVIAWRLLPKAARPQPRNGKWVTEFWDDKTKRFRVVESRVAFESIGREDPEIVDRTKLHEMLRPGLTGERE